MSPGEGKIPPGWELLFYSDTDFVYFLKIMFLFASLFLSLELSIPCPNSSTEYVITSFFSQAQGL